MAGTNLQELQQGGVPVKKERTLLDLLSDPKVTDGFGKVIGNAMTPKRMVQLCVVAARKTPDLMKCDPSSVLGAMMALASLGLEPNTPQGQAYLIPYAKRRKVNGQWEVVGYECQLQIGYRGYITLAHRSPHISYLQAECIHENDHFVHRMGSNALFEYEKKLKDRGPVIGAFCYVKFANGNEAACVLTLEEIEKIRECSDTYVSLRDGIEKETGYKRKKAEDKFADTPWVKWFDDMAVKSVIKKMCKQLPLEQGTALAVASNLEGGDGRIIDMASMVDPDRALAVAKGEIEPDEVESVEGIAYQDADTLEIPAIQIPKGEMVPAERQQEEPARQEHRASGPSAELSSLMKKMFSAKTDKEVNAIVSEGAGLSEDESNILRNRAISKIDEISRGGQMSIE